VHEAPAHRWLSVAFTASETRSHNVCVSVRKGGGRQDGRQTLTLKEGRRPEGRVTVRGPATVLLYWYEGTRNVVRT